MSDREVLEGTLNLLLSLLSNLSRTDAIFQSDYQRYFKQVQQLKQILKGAN